MNTWRSRPRDAREIRLRIVVAAFLRFCYYDYNFFLTIGTATHRVCRDCTQ